MAETTSRVALFSTKDRKAGVVSSIKTLNSYPVKNKNVIIKPRISQ